MTQQKFGADNLGVMFDGAHGQAHNDSRLVALAAEYGYLPWDVDEDGPEMAEEASDALDYLNENACDDGYAFEWIDGDLCLVEHRRVGSADISVQSDDRYDAGPGEPITAYAIESVRIALPGEDSPEIPTQFDWLNSITVDFAADEYGETVTFYASTGDPRGAMSIARLTRLSDGTVTLHGPDASSVRSHEHYAKHAGAPGFGWKIR